MTHRDEELDSLLGKMVEITFHSGKTIKGILSFTSDFSEKYHYRKPGHYHCSDYDFRKSHIKKVRRIQG